MQIHTTPPGCAVTVIVIPRPNPRRLLRLALGLCLALVISQPTDRLQAAQAKENRPEPGGRGVRTRQLTDTGAHYRVWQTTDPANPATTTGGYVELAAGLNRWDATRQAWVPAEARFERVADGHFVARLTQHRAILAPALGVEAAVDLSGPDEVRLRSSLIGIALIDARTGRNCLLAEVKPARGQLAGPDTVVYENAFEGLAGDVRYVIGLGRFEQDVILRERLTPEILAELGLDPDQTRVLVLTEFFAPPRPIRHPRQLHLGGSGVLTDEELIFGLMVMGAGQAAAATSDSPSIPVSKSWELLDGRQVLVEAIPYPALLAVSTELPVLSLQHREVLKTRVRRTASSSPSPTDSPSAFPSLRLPAPLTDRLARQNRPETSPRDDSATTPDRSAFLAGAVVIDYPLTLQSSLTDFVFRGDTTYVVAGPLSLAGTTTVEAGTVIKFTPGTGASLILGGPVDCQTGPYRTAILTSRNDDSVGEILPDSTGNPQASYGANPALQLMRTGQVIHDLRIAHAQVGVFFHDWSAGSASLRHVQFVRCGTAIRANGYATTYENLTLHNVLIDDAAQALAGYSLTGRAEHLTISRCSQLTSDTQSAFYGTCSTLSLLNSILVAVSNLGPMSVSQAFCQSSTTTNGVFQGCGAGGHYLAQSAWLNTGTTNIDPTLARELRQKTTAPPVIRTGTPAADHLWSPQTARDLDPPDPGFHYDPIDLAIGGWTVGAGRSLTVLPDTVVTCFGSRGVKLDPGARLRAEGQPLHPVRCVDYRLVQEQSLNWGGATNIPVLFGGADATATDNTAAPAATFSFAEFSSTSTPFQWLRSDTDSRWSTLAFHDCQVYGGRLPCAGNQPTVLSLRNCLFQRVALSLRQGVQLAAANLLCRGGSGWFERPANGGIWVVRDSAFHDFDLTDAAGGIVHDHNAYLGGEQKQFLGSTLANLVLPNFRYAAGPLGGFYHGMTNLLDAGSRSASAAGLFHHTTLVTQTKETNSVVDIGFHAIAFGSNANAAQAEDTDRDGIPDYLEDTNGNGTVNTAETDWRNPRDLGLQVRISRPARSVPAP